MEVSLAANNIEAFKLAIGLLSETVGKIVRAITEEIISGQEKESHNKAN